MIKNLVKRNFPGITGKFGTGTFSVTIRDLTGSAYYRPFRQTSFQWKFANAVFTFCQGFNKKLGFLFNLGKGTFETRHMLKINPQATPELLRRARAEWSIENLELKANQTQVGFQGDTARRSSVSLLENH